ncbi:hypothetical protein MKO06_08685 [Gramella sp. GC03-9]|uniref:Lipocalin-like domain-containing protein n=1 Tax=Christiangramia oceanisediminis TaxID=2920386 RepID=A0A9X2KWI5_9FLAO|nr:hypothetical protein [Gramella oceanisediminis]MCP9199980.1 hypothetical protein [Gramella oceanisediminis]
MVKFLGHFRIMKYHKIFLLLLFINSAYAQDIPSKTELENEIIGTWHLEKSPEDKIVFFKDGTLKRFIGDILKSTSHYKITKDCNGEQLLDNWFLKETDSDGVSNCVYIEGINANNNGILSLMTTSQGKIVIYTKED